MLEQYPWEGEKEMESRTQEERLASDGNIGCSSPSRGRRESHGFRYDALVD